MEVKFTFTASVYIVGDNLKEIKEIWENNPLIPTDGTESGTSFFEYGETLAIEDAYTHESIVDQFSEA